MYRLVDFWGVKGGGVGVGKSRPLLNPTETVVVIIEGLGFRFRYLVLFSCSLRSLAVIFGVLSRDL